jgi:hypothetical protein
VQYGPDGQRTVKYTEEPRAKTLYYNSMWQMSAGSAQTVANGSGKLHERIEYTPYGEVWIEERGTGHDLETPYRFTGKELDAEPVAECGSGGGGVHSQCAGERRGA